MRYRRCFSCKVLVDITQMIFICFFFKAVAGSTHTNETAKSHGKATTQVRSETHGKATTQIRSETHGKTTKKAEVHKPKANKKPEQDKNDPEKEDPEKYDPEKGDHPGIIVLFSIKSYLIQ